jgi:protocatechuate 3,4-dioxygenase beta subunit
MSQFRSGSLIARLAVGLLLLPFSISLFAQTLTPPTPRRTGPFRVAGTIVSSTEGHALSRARVSLQDVKDEKNGFFMITGDDGHFQFANLPAGKYSLTGAKRGYITASYDGHEQQFSTAIVTGADLDTENLTLRLAPTATLTGHVLDEFGDPVRNADITLWRDDHSAGISRTVRFREDTSDDQGAFEFAPLDAGTYFVSVVAKPWYAVHPPSTHPEHAPDIPVSVDRSLDVVYPPTYHQGATAVEDATPLLVRGGDHVDLDLRLTPVSALHVILRTPLAEGTPAGEQAFQYPVLSKRDFDGSQFYVAPDIQMTSPGVFEMVTSPGKYDVRLSPGNAGPGKTTEVDIGEDTRELDLSTGEAVGSVTAKLELVGETTFPPRMELALRNARSRVVSWQRVSSNHNVTFPEVVPGKYDVLAGGELRPYSVIRMKVNGATVSGHSLKVPPGATMDVSLSLVGGAADVNGYAQRAGKATPGAMIVLVPDHPEANRELFRRDQSDLDGSFTFHSVIPGTYTVIAIQDGWDLDWSKPALIARYAAHGQRLVVSEASHSAIQLPDPVRIQPK